MEGVCFIMARLNALRLFVWFLAGFCLIFIDLLLILVEILKIKTISSRNVASQRKPRNSVPCLQISRGCGVVMGDFIHLFGQKPKSGPTSMIHLQKSLVHHLTAYCQVLMEFMDPHGVDTDGCGQLWWWVGRFQPKCSYLFKDQKNVES